MESKFHLEILPKRQKLLFDSLSGSDWIEKFYLAGGTALALQIAHRRSIDFDFFAEQEFDTWAVRKKLALLGDYRLSSESEQILDGRLNTVRISFFNLPYKLIRPATRFKHMRIVSREDIAAMKLAAISMRGSRKDFIDLFFLLKEFSLDEMIHFYEQKYGKKEENVYCVLKGLVYFADAEERPMPGLLRRVSWRDVKKHVIHVHNEYIQGIKSGSFAR